MLLARRRSRVVLSLTPLIDVVFILLVFFMLASQFADWRKVELTPAASLGEATDTKPAIVRLEGDTAINVNGMAVTDLAAATSRLQAMPAGAGALVTADDEVPIQRVVDTVEAFNAAGIEGVQLAEAAE